VPSQRKLFQFPLTLQIRPQGRIKLYKQKLKQKHVLSSKLSELSESWELRINSAWAALTPDFSLKRVKIGELYLDEAPRARIMHVR
jgi:hypothetical protein